MTDNKNFLPNEENNVVGMGSDNINERENAFPSRESERSSFSNVETSATSEATQNASFSQYGTDEDASVKNNGDFSNSSDISSSDVAFSQSSETVGAETEHGGASGSGIGNGYGGYYSSPSNEPKKNRKPKKVKKEKRRGGIAALWVVTAFCLVVSLASAAISVSGFYLRASGGDGSFVYPSTLTPQYETAQSGSTDLLTVAGVAEKVLPSVVMITAEINSGYTTGTSMGSGFFITTDGVIVTNHHVVENAVSVLVTTNDGTEYPAEILGTDSTTDIAVLKVDGSDFPAAELGDSSQTKVGDQVVAIGTPYDASLQNTVTAGYISAVRDDYRFSSLSRVLSVFQHDAAINSGNSGGPLCNMYGQVIGINSVKVSSTEYENIGFAIQISSVSDIITELINNGSVDRPMIGITAQTDNTIGGALVVAVTANSPADQGGVKVGDIITKVDNQRVTSTEELINYFSQKSVGDTVELTVLRDAENQVLSMTLFSTSEYNSLTQEEAERSSSSQDNENSSDRNDAGGIFGDYFSQFFN